MTLNLADEFPREEVEWRAGTMNRDGTSAMALAYIDARCVMQRLDDVLGPAGWQCRYGFSPDGKKTICELGVRVITRNKMTQADGTVHEFPASDWIWRADGAGDSDIEPEKGSLSDAFKRAAVRFGVGRYLYGLPSPWVRCESYEGRDGKRRFKRFLDDPWAAIPRPRPALVEPAQPALPPPVAAPAAVGGAVGELHNPPASPDEFLAFEKRILATLATLDTVAAIERLWKMNRDPLGQMRTRYSKQWEGIASQFKQRKEEIEHAAV